MKKLNYIFISYDGIAYPVAYKLLKEGRTVLIGQLQDIKELKEKDDKPEKPVVKKRRLESYKGILHKMTMPELISTCAKIKDKDNWFVMCDFNNLWHYAEVFQKMGFTKGLFPTKEDYEGEMDRQKSKELVKKEYPGLTVAPVTEFKKVPDGIQHMTENPDMHFVLKGNADQASTICPTSEHPILSAQEVISELEKDPKIYEQSGFILEEKITKSYEMTPEMVFYDGKPVMATVDIENKNMGAGSNEGYQIGCSQNLVIRIDIESPICKIAFPDYIYKKAKQHKGVFVTDAGLMCKDGQFYFTEFCSQRFGYDSFFTELAMCDSVSDFFESLVKGENPLKKKYGAAVRGLNLKKDDDRWSAGEMNMSWLDEEDKNIWVYDMKKKDGKTVNVGSGDDLAVFTGSADDIKTAVNKAYTARKAFSFSGVYSRPKEDFMSTAYLSSIPNRFGYAKDNQLFR